MTIGQYARRVYRRGKKTGLWKELAEKAISFGKMTLGALLCFVFFSGLYMTISIWFFGGEFKSTPDVWAEEKETEKEYATEEVFDGDGHWIKVHIPQD